MRTASLGPSMYRCSQRAQSNILALLEQSDRLEASVCLLPFLCSSLATTVFSAFFSWSLGCFVSAAKGSFAKCSCASRLLPVQMLRTTVGRFFPVITLITLVVLHIPVEPRRGEAWVCIAKTRVVMFARLFHGEITYKVITATVWTTALFLHL